MFSRFTFLVRIFVIYLVQLMIKGFDYSFGGLFDITFRGVFFTLFFSTIWISVWYAAEWVNKRISGLVLILRLNINVALGYVAAFITNIGYRAGDIHFYHNENLWKEIPVFNPELTISLLLMYLIGFGGFEYYRNNIKIKEEQIKAEKLQKENIQAQYKSLKAQIEPHFLFNSLSVLSSIIHSDANLASDFVVKLSKTLRYLIEQNEYVLVTLKEELEIVNDYFFLLRTRFGNKIHFVNEIENIKAQVIYIPPTSIQILFENAVKHNKLSESVPLIITIKNEDGFICIKNNLNSREERIESTGTGLKNIIERYRLIANKNVRIIKSEEEFQVYLPVLTKRDYENINH